MRRSKKVAELGGPQRRVAGPVQQFLDLRARLSARVSARKPRISSGVGRAPVTSSDTRRRNVASSHNSAGGTLSRRSLSKMCRSMKLFSFDFGECRSRLARHQQDGHHRLGTEAGDHGSVAGPHGPDHPGAIHRRPPHCRAIRRNRARSRPPRSRRRTSPRLAAGSSSPGLSVWRAGVTLSRRTIPCSADPAARRGQSS